MHHPVLDNFDILCLVSECFDSKTYSEARSLAALAQVCKAFTSPAIRVLWRSLDSLFPLFRLLSSFQLRLDDDGSYVPTYHLSDGYVDPEELARFVFYAQHVLNAEQRLWHDKAVIHISAFRVIVDELGPCRPLLPNLLKLDWEQPSHEDTGLFAILPPSLQSLNIQFSNFLARNPPRAFEPQAGATLAVEHMLKKIPAASPALERFAISDLQYQVSTLPISSFKLLKSLSVSRCRGAASIVACIPGLSSMPCLMHLTLRDEEAPASSRVAHLADLPALRSLDITGPVSRLTDIITLVSAPSLDTLYITPTSAANVEEYHYFLARIGTKWRPSLHTLTLNFPHIAFEDLSGEEMGFLPYIQPLLILHDLRSLSITGLSFPSYQLTCNDVHNMASAWPHLRTLKIPVNLPIVLPSFHVVVEFARRCPHLETLVLPAKVDSSFLHSALYEPLTAPVVSTTLQHLEFGANSKRRDRERLEQILMRIFPNVSLDDPIWHAPKLPDFRATAQFLGMSLMNQTH